ncbi:MAG: DNA mismatch repair endonuclease MutL [Candidatus Kapabacteria bacterium]|nr:DNA mismatch repair endonuclease MutL [Candidatus Kapabacteria bacterium]
MDTSVLTITMVAMNNDQRIAILPDVLANQIAAGEVVQRPESVVKELVENAIDAGASHITVVVRNAGKQLIHVIDNGSGMSRADLELSIVRHATSKIVTAADLHAIRTLGFRGEALASIAAVADVEIRTRRPEDATGWTLISRSGSDVAIAPSALDPGTQILVRNLFYTVPARRKFLKTDLTEFRHISETMQRLALSRPDVRCTFYDGSSLVFDVRPGTLAERIAGVLAIDARSTLMEVHGEEGGVRISGMVGRPSIARQSRSGQYFFLNGRPIVSRQLAHAVVTAFEHVLEPGHHPVFVLEITVDPERVDVNVHPQKHEVKFDDERLVYLVVQQAIMKALQDGLVVPRDVGMAPLAAMPLQSLPGGAPSQSMVVNRFTGEILSEQRPSTAGWQSGSAAWSSSGSRFTGPARQNYAQLFTEQPPSEETLALPVLQADSRYIITSRHDGLLVVDQQAAHERVLYERLLRKEGADAAVSQALLFAATAQLSGAHRALLREYLDEFSALGFRLEINDDGTVRVLAVPGDIHPGMEESVLADLLHEMEGVGRLPAERKREHLAAVYATRQAVRRGTTLGADEQQALIRDLFSCAVPHVSPVGRPTYVIISFDELHHRFT